MSVLPNLRLYRGLSVDILSNFIYWTISYSTFDYLYRVHSPKKEYSNFRTKALDIFGATSMNAVFASLIIYPLDTFKRHLQVNNGFGFIKEYNNIAQGFMAYLKTPIAEKYR
jgi:hypothetical protein